MLRVLLTLMLCHISSANSHTRDGRATCESGDCTAISSGLLQAAKQLAEGPALAELTTELEGITSGNATGGKWLACTTASIMAIPDVVLIGVNAAQLGPKCDEGLDACSNTIKAFISQLISLVHKFTNKDGIVAACSGEGNTCAAKISAPDGPLESLNGLQSNILGVVKKCQGKPAIEALDCIDIPSILTPTMAFVQSLINSIHECKKGCKKVEVLNGCLGHCEQGGGNWKCHDRVSHLYGSKGFTLNAAVFRVNDDCCHACVCSQADFPDLEDCDKPCSLNGQMFSCANRINWVFNNAAAVKGNKQASIDLINVECEDQCSCNVDSKSLAKL